MVVSLAIKDTDLASIVHGSSAHKIKLALTS
jgi:hypothetical protein